jgi:GrpB-like predicted nucleotidyltransferase (UPF0157 family)
MSESPSLREAMAFGLPVRNNKHTMTEPIEIVPYNPAWKTEFAAIAAHLRAALGPVAARIDHVGSTAIAGLAAKPVIDIQISVSTLEPVDPFRHPLEALGYVFRADNPERTKRYFREAQGARRTHIHVRQAGSWGEQFALLFRDFVRADPAAAARYAAAKHALAEKYRHDRSGYVDAKQPVIWEIMLDADAWSQRVGWQPGPSDA